ncbi:MAG: arylformamidase [Sphingomonadales bacterium]|nr:arylformamidase [Sphingomonadales bacterium]
MATIYDISQPVRVGIPVFPGDTPYREDMAVQISSDCPVNVAQIEMSPHTGSHADGPLHYAEGAPSVGEVDVTAYLGPCHVVDARHCQGLITVDDVVDALPNRFERVLFRTYEVFPENNWVSDFTAVAPELIDLLAHRGCRLIGLDSPSLDPEVSKTLDSHQRVLAHDMRVLEGLVLDHVPYGEYELIAPPLKLMTADASPVRALLREL